MNKNHKYFNTTKHERKAFAITMLVILLCLFTLGILWAIGEFDDPFYVKHQVEYPIANANISWQQTYHSGPWSDAT